MGFHLYETSRISKSEETADQQSEILIFQLQAVIGLYLKAENQPLSAEGRRTCKDESQRKHLEEHG